MGRPINHAQFMPKRRFKRHYWRSGDDAIEVPAWRFVTRAYPPTRPVSGLKWRDTDAVTVVLHFPLQRLFTFMNVLQLCMSLFI